MKGMSMTEVEEKVSALIVQVCDTDEVLSDPDLDLFEAGLIDSMGFVKLLFGLEQEFGIQVPPTEIERDDVSTVTKILAFVNEKL